MHWNAAIIVYKLNLLCGNVFNAARFPPSHLSVSLSGDNDEELVVSWQEKLFSQVEHSVLVPAFQSK